MTYIFVYQEWDILKEQNKDCEMKVEKLLNTSNHRPPFGFQLQEARIRKRLTTVDVANAANVTAKMISMFENGIEIPNQYMTQLLNNILEIN
tara:strand:- start:1019 stop:1294 length:276 start_codon:yes stop_codon:yes gene_type:complete